MEDKSEITTDLEKAEGGVYTVIDGITYYYVYADYDNGGDPPQR